MTRVTKTATTAKESWAVAEAKAHFSEVIDRAIADGPQLITRKGRQTAVIVSAAEWTRKTKRQGTLSEFFANSPLSGSALDLERRADLPRHLEL
ncbi:MAG TPA: type II toxin-antitoxin system Phd/YefM family antitoxin [Candidatus Dormibacteraeota bacterium]|nr:type II toxin-antitoxin system Phd/YefM family antitoxin [Candidatus Dormibacteraeota bacterium]